MHEAPDDEENAAELKFGPDFFTPGERCLSIDEVSLFLRNKTHKNDE